MCPSFFIRILRVTSGIVICNCRQAIFVDAMGHIFTCTKNVPVCKKCPSDNSGADPDLGRKETVIEMVYHEDTEW